MAYIAYKYPFNNEGEQITKVARFFGVLVVLSIIFGIYLGWDNFNTAKENKSSQQSLKDTITSLNHNIKSLGNKIDSIGYKIDKSGKLVPKKEVAPTVKTVVKYLDGVKQRRLNDTYKKIIFNVIGDHKEDTIMVRFNVDKESRVFKDEIVKYLQSKGYKNVIPIVALWLYGDDDLVAKPFAGKYAILIFPESNVKK